MPVSEALSDLKGALRPDFHWGYATAAAQIEGAATTDGRGPSIWDGFAKESGRVIDGSNPSQATRAFEFYKDDVKLLKALGVNAYRFSLSWSRIIPLGGRDDPVSVKGIQFYSKFIDELLHNGITPFVTLFHWDLPQALEDRYSGMLNVERYTPDFVRYARVCFESFGDRVKHWVTYNEPGVYSLAGYAAGVHAPARSSYRDKNECGDSSTEPFIVAHTELISHAYVYRLYCQDFKPRQSGTIGITLHGNWSEPFDESSQLDQAAAERALEFEIAWFADPLYRTGEYPASMRAQLGDRLPKFTAEQRKLVLHSSDFYGMNSYTSFYIKHRDGTPDINDHSGHIEKGNVNSKGVSRGPEAPTYWLASCPWGYYKLLKWVYSRYNMPIYLTENGTTAPYEDFQSPPADGPIEDRFRIAFFDGYLESVARAVKEDGVDIRSYFVWTFTDNWEWAAGYTDRFGTVWIDFESQEKTRYPKKSAKRLQETFEHLIAQK